MERSERTAVTTARGHRGILMLLLACSSTLSAQSAERTPQQMSAGAPQVLPGQVLQTVRHTLVASVGTVTQVALSSPRRLGDASATEARFGAVPSSAALASAAASGADSPGVAPSAEPAQDGRITRWSRTVSVRGNVAMRVELHAVGSDAAGRWSLLPADNRGAVPILRGSGPQLLPGQFAPGRHEVELLWEGVGPDAKPPQLLARVIPMGAAR